MTFSIQSIRKALAVLCVSLTLIPYSNCSAPDSESAEGELLSIVGVEGYGELTTVSKEGLVTGWAMDHSSDSKKVTVSFYSGNPDGGGKRIGAIVATGFGANTKYNGHYFSYQLPREFSDGQVRTLWVYAGEIKNANIIKYGIKPYQSYSPNPEGMAFFQSKVQPLLAADCSECHATTTYTTFYYALFHPSPFESGTKINNNLINSASGSGHQGGNRCPGGKNSSPCLEMQQWWDIEFN